MAYGSPYATWAEYKARTGAQGDTGQATVDAALDVASRLIERWTGRVFNASSAGVVRYFDGNGMPELWIDDFTALTAAAVDVDEDGTYSQAITLTALLKRPYNAAEVSEPFTSLELSGGRSAELSAWPAISRGVKLTGTWGWPAVPDAIVDATIMVARQVRELRESGLTLTIQAVDEQLRVRPGAFPLIAALRDEYSRRLPTAAWASF